MNENNNQIETEKTLEKLIKESENLNKNKVSLVFKAVPPVKQIQNFKISRDITIGGLIAMLKRKFPAAFEEKTSYILYCGHDFALSPSSYIGDLYDNFASGESLIISYASMEAWG